MRPVHHPTTNDVLLPPPGSTPEECQPLPVTRVRFFPSGAPSVRSYWQPSEVERAAIAAGAPIFLSAMGMTHPPIHLGVDGVEEP